MARVWIPPKDGETRVALSSSMMCLSSLAFMGRVFALKDGFCFATDKIGSDNFGPTRQDKALEGVLVSPFVG